MLKNQKGITLVALVITIIVLLILAGVSISLVIGDNGILNQASNAGSASIDGEFRQAVQIAAMSARMTYTTESLKNADYDETTPYAANGVFVKELTEMGYTLKSGTPTTTASKITVARGTGENEVTREFTVTVTADGDLTIAE